MRRTDAGSKSLLRPHRLFVSPSSTGLRTQVFTSEHPLLELLRVPTIFCCNIPSGLLRRRFCILHSDEERRMGSFTFLRDYGVNVSMVEESACQRQWWRCVSSRVCRLEETDSTFLVGFRVPCDAASLLLTLHTTYSGRMASPALAASLAQLTGLGTPVDRRAMPARASHQQKVDVDIRALQMSPRRRNSCCRTWTRSRIATKSGTTSTCVRKTSCH